MNQNLSTSQKLLKIAVETAREEGKFSGDNKQEITNWLNTELDNVTTPA